VPGQDLSLQSTSRHKVQGELGTEEAEISRAANRMAHGSRKSRDFLARRSAKITFLKLENAKRVNTHTKMLRAQISLENESTQAELQRS
jgi:hypothetical protein